MGSGRQANPVGRHRAQLLLLRLPAAIAHAQIKLKSYTRNMSSDAPVTLAPRSAGLTCVYNTVSRVFGVVM
jgi:hypothetical protein